MGTFTRRVAVLAAAVVMPASTVAVAITTGGPADAGTVLHAANGKAVHESLTAAIDRLHVASETNAGYSRTLFKLWVDADHNCRDTRAEVLMRDSTSPVSGGCTIKGGTWNDWYDNTTYTQASQLDIDHLVPLEEVWASGGKKWSAAKREAYANDLADTHTLVAVSLHANRSKGDKEPDEWMPADNDCRYFASWVLVKTRWSLSIDSAEKSFLLTQAKGCGNPKIRTHLAVVQGGPGTTSTSTGASSGSAPSTSSSTSTDSGTGSSTSTGCYPLSAAGNCYQAGQFCASSQHGTSGVDANGETIRCVSYGSSWRWSH